MIRLFAMVLMAPFWVHLLFAGGVLAFGQYSHDAGAKTYAEKVRLSQVAPPEVVSIVDFKSDAPRNFPVEVNLRAQVAIEHNVQLVKTENGKTDSERAMYILVDPDAPSGAKVAYGAIVLDPSEIDLFSDWAAQQVYTGGALGPILTFGGLRQQPYDKSHILNALKNQGFTAAKGFTYVDPFLKGREAGLAILPRDEPAQMIYTYLIAAAFGLMGLLKIGLRLRRKGKVSAAAPIVAQAQAFAAPEDGAPSIAPEVGFVAKPELARNDFIGALARKSATAALAQAAQTPSAIVPANSAFDKFAVIKRERVRGMAAFGGALALYMVFANFGGALEMTSMRSVMGFFGAKPQVGEITMTAFVPTPASQVPITLPVAAPNTTAPKNAVVTSGLMEMEMGWVKANIAELITVARAQMGPWRNAVPLWLMACIIAFTIAVSVLFSLRKMGAGRGGKVVKLPDNDPFERLLQRRLAEKARAEKKVMGGMALLRA